MFFKLIARIQFLLTSTNQHGVHSPFVFDFVTKGLYQKSLKLIATNDFLASQKLRKKEQKILAKITAYFGVESIVTSVNELEITSSNSYKILFVNTIDNFNFDILPVNTSKLIVVLHGIHDNKATQEKWGQLCTYTKATVTIDLFYFGLIFFREAQAKEHFKIRV
ncbi:MAG: hypothetical protein NWQ17_05100 [Polaribacter sp.]|nr:hypothetical protein [Polaribacter sp.]